MLQLVNKSSKGYDRLLTSWQIVHEKHPSWQLSIYEVSETWRNNSTNQMLKIESSVNFYEPVKILRMFL
jgi:hypothetical protein